MHEQRKAFRINVSMAIAFSSNGNFLCGDIMNISCNGVFIMTDTVLSVDTELALRIRLPDDEKIMGIVGRVAWAKQVSNKSPAGLGIEFVRIAAEDRSRIAHFVDTRRYELNPAETLSVAHMPFGGSRIKANHMPEPVIRLEDYEFGKY